MAMTNAQLWRDMATRNVTISEAARLMNVTYKAADKRLRAECALGARPRHYPSSWAIETAYRELRSNWCRGYC